MKNTIFFFFLVFLFLSFMYGCVSVNTQEQNFIRIDEASVDYVQSGEMKSFEPASLPEFINLDYNIINSFSQEKGLINFYQKLQKLENGGQGQLNIGHFGGSHVQAGQLTSALRQQFDYFSSNSRGPRGFVFPSRLVKSNGPDYTKIDFPELWQSCKSPNNNHHCEWGMAGQTANTVLEKQTLKTWSFDMDSVLYPFQSIRIYRKDIDEAYEVVVKNAKVQVTANDSYVDIEYEKLQDTLEIDIVKRKTGNSSFELQGFLFKDKNETGITYHDFGVNGAGINSYLRCELLEEQLLDIKLDLVIIGLGLNDTYVPEDRFRSEELKQEYQQFINLMKKINPSVSILLLTNNDHYYRKQASNRNARPFNDIIESLAKRNKLSSWDLYNLMGGANSITQWEKQELAKPDLIHFTDTGYHLQANLLFEALMDDYSK